MKKFIILAVLLTLLSVFANSTDAFRCGKRLNNLVREGKHKYQILKDCGHPFSREVVGVSKKDGTRRIIEEWLYIIDVHGNHQMYLIKFDRYGIAVEIDWLGEQK